MRSPLTDADRRLPVRSLGLHCITEQKSGQKTFCSTPITFYSLLSLFCTIKNHREKPTFHRCFPSLLQRPAASPAQDKRLLSHLLLSSFDDDNSLFRARAAGLAQLHRCSTLLEGLPGWLAQIHCPASLATASSHCSSSVSLWFSMALVTHARVDQCHSTK